MHLLFDILLTCYRKSNAEIYDFSKPDPYNEIPDNDGEQKYCCFVIVIPVVQPSNFDVAPRIHGDLKLIHLFFYKNTFFFAQAGCFYFFSDFSLRCSYQRS